MIRNWDFKSSTPPKWYRRVRRHEMLYGWRLAPSFSAIVPVFPNAHWTLYFIYSPDGRLKAQHRFTLARLRELDRKLLVICAAPDKGAVPAELLGLADALYWKSPGGWDFSGYALGLRAIVEFSEHADVFLLNDSMFGPFAPLQPLLARARWDLTGFTASAELENHVQSYAFLLRDVSRQRLRPLRWIFPRNFAFNEFDQVICCQETRMARVAAKAMSVGALWFAAEGEGNPTLLQPFELLDDGFPFLKRSLTGQMQHVRKNEEVRQRLEILGHPLETRVEP